MKTRYIVGITYFTENGKELAKRLKDNCPNVFFEEKPDVLELSLWVKQCFYERIPLVFICATGIAVRIIAPFVENKLSDSPVIVMDELGENVIPILSGHFGGANEIAKDLADALSANAIITTATDLHQAFSVDVFARKNGLRILDKDGIKVVASKTLKQEGIQITSSFPYSVEGNLPKNVEISHDSASVPTDVYLSDEAQEGFTLIPKRLVLGMGCKKNKSFEELLEFIKSEFSLEELRQNLYGIATIDVKENEVGLMKLAQFLGAKFMTYTGEELRSVEGGFPESPFVEETVGVSNVCERAAVLGAGLKERNLVLEKKTGNGMTLAAAKRSEIHLSF